MDINLKELINPCIELAKKAGVKTLEFYKTNVDLGIKTKLDSTPVTNADIAAHNVIVEGLKALTPELPILSEEAANIPYHERKQWNVYWLIDPVDGTKEFINQTDEFTVNIALIKNGHSILGVIYAPVLDDCYFAYENQGAYKQHKNQTPAKITSRRVDPKSLFATVSRRHSVQQAVSFLEKIPNHTKIPKGSSLKTCLIAEGLADAYPCFGKTSEWDMGAAQCIIEEAGGMMVSLEFQPIVFNQKESLLNPPLLVVGDRDYNWGQYFI